MKSDLRRVYDEQLVGHEAHSRRCVRPFRVSRTAVEAIETTQPLCKYIFVPRNISVLGSVPKRLRGIQLAEDEKVNAIGERRTLGELQNADMHHESSLTATNPAE